MKANKEQVEEIASLVEQICCAMGKNQAHDWDGIENTRDIILYLKSIKKGIPYKSIFESYSVNSKDI